MENDEQHGCSKCRQKHKPPHRALRAPASLWARDKDQAVCRFPHSFSQLQWPGFRVRTTILGTCVRCGGHLKSVGAKRGLCVCARGPQRFASKAHNLHQPPPSLVRVQKTMFGNGASCGGHLESVTTECDQWGKAPPVSPLVSGAHI